MTNFRIGHGYDVHRLVSGRKLILGGVDIPYEFGLLGHSDADVLVHAVMDALLGAAAMPDIGRLFPDSAMEYEAADSIELLKKVRQLLKDGSYLVANVDCTVIAQCPKLASFITQMRINIAQAIEIPVSCVNIKATTEEGLGFTGAGHGIAAHAVVLIEKEIAQ